MTRTTPWDMRDSRSLHHAITLVLPDRTWEYEYPPPQNHRIRNICTLELIEAEHTGRLCNIRRNHRQRIEVIPIFHLDHMHALMYILHEIVEVDARFVLDIRRESFEEEVHEHGLAAAHVAVHVQSLRQVLRYTRRRRFACAASE